VLVYTVVYFYVSHKILDPIHHTNYVNTVLELGYYIHRTTAHQNLPREVPPAHGPLLNVLSCGEYRRLLQSARLSGIVKYESLTAIQHLIWLFKRLKVHSTTQCQGKLNCKEVSSFGFKHGMLQWHKSLVNSPLNTLS